MKFTTRIDHIQKAIAQLSSLSVKNTSLPILSSVLIEVTGNAIFLRSTNLNVGVEVTLSGTSEEEGVCAVELALLQGVVAGIRASGTLYFERTGTSLRVHGEGVEVELRINPHEDFPTLPKPADSSSAFLISTQDFISGVRSVAFSASTSEIKPEIASVSIYADGDSLVFVATDSFRLAERRIPVKGLDDFPGVLIPVKHIQEVIRVLGFAEETVSLVISDYQVSFSTQTLYCTSRVLDGDFPDYGQIIPSQSDTTVIALKQDVQEMLKVTQVFMDRLARLTFDITVSNGSCLCRTDATDAGKGEVSLDCSLEGVDTVITLNRKYLQDCLQVIQEDSVSLGFSSGKPIVVRGVGNLSFLYLIMPMKQ